MQYYLAIGIKDAEVHGFGVCRCHNNSYAAVKGMFNEYQSDFPSLTIPYAVREDLRLKLDVKQRRSEK